MSLGCAGAMPGIGGSASGHVLDDLERPSGKGPGDENFPVASWLLPASSRPHVMAFYAFVRAADDIADDAALEPGEKLRRLDLFERALLGEEHALSLLPKAATLRASLMATGVTERHALDLLSAFRQDAERLRYRDWPDLMAYCALSASPVGRFLLDLHGESPNLHRLSDPLCDALQLLNHLQDCRDDFLALDRVYLPGDAFEAAGIDVAELAKPAASLAMREVLDQTLDGVDALLRQAAALPRRLARQRLAAETAVVLEMANALSAALRRRDPLAGRVTLSRPRFALVSIMAIGRLQWLRRGETAPAVAGSGDLS